MKKEFSLEEQIILNCIDERYKWIARDEFDRLILFEDKPFKNVVDTWISDGILDIFGVFNHLFHNVRLEDAEPTEIIRDPNVKQLLDSSDKKYNKSEHVIKQDAINPVHYVGNNGLQAIEVHRNFMSNEQLQGYHLGNVLKYTMRFQKKNGVEDLEKARKHLDWLIDMFEDKGV